MKTAKVGISECAGNEHKATFYAVEMTGVKYKQNSDGQWLREIVREHPDVFRCATPEKKHWKKVTGINELGKLEAAVAEHLAAQESE